MRVVSFSDFQHKSLLEGVQVSPRVEESIVRNSSRLMARYPFFGELLYKLKIRFTTQIPTWATDGKHIFINPQFTAPLTDSQIVFVFCHEIMHNVMGHFYRMGNRDHNLWNQATDLEINPLLVAEGLLTEQELTNGLHGLYDKNFLDMSAEQIYAILEKDSKLQNKFKDKNNFGGVMKPEEGKQVANNSVSPESSEEREERRKNYKDENHEAKEKDRAIEKKTKAESEEEKKAAKAKSSEKDEDPEGEDEEAGIEKGNSSSTNGDDDGDGGSEGDGDGDDESSESLAKGWRDAASKAASGKGIGEGIKRAIDGLRKAQVNWREELKKFIGAALSNAGFKMPAKRHLYRKMYVRSLKRTYEGVDSVVVCVDTSGSITQEQLTIFLSEVQTIIEAKKPREVKVIYFDHQVENVVSLKDKVSLDGAKGGGGTDFEPPLKWITDNIINKGRKVDVVVFFTDGYANLDLPRPVYDKKFIWIITDDLRRERIHLPPWGKRLDISTEDLT